MNEVVATLVADRAAGLADIWVGKAQSLIQALGGRVSQPMWLSSREATDLIVTGIGTQALTMALAPLRADMPIDIIVQPVATRRKKLLIADMESTIIKEEMLDELAGMMGLRDKVATITARAMNGELDFIAALNERVALLAGQPIGLLDEAAQLMQLMPGAAELVGTMTAKDGKCWLVSGGFMFFAEIIGKRVGFNRVCANRLALDGNKLAGTVTPPILDKDAKRTLLAEACVTYSAMPIDCIAVGDGANDVPMLEYCNTNGGLGVAFHAKPAVRDVIPNQINHTGLATLLFAQGYRRDQFIASGA